MSKIFVYGTLLQGCSNHTRFEFHTQTKFIKSFHLSGFQMYNLGSYPCIYKTGTLSDKVYGELYEYLDSETETQIRKMELGAGYTEIILNRENETFLTYIYKSVPSYAKLIVSGNWKER